MPIVRFDSTMRCFCRAIGLVCFFALAAPAITAASSSQAPVRAALVTGPGDDSLGGLADLVAANLHADDGLQILERQDIQAVLAEHKLAGAGLTDPARAIAVGRLLSVDVFAVLDIQPGGIGLVVYDGRSGVRLADHLLEGRTADQRAIEAATALRRGLQKHRSQTHPVCLLTVRNADLGSSMDCFCDGIGQILQRQLLNSRDVTILERKYLDAVNKERALPTSRPSMPLLPSLEFLELEIGRGKPPFVYSAKVFVTDSQGNRLAMVTASADEPGILSQQLLAGVIDKIGAGTPQPADAVRESKRFALESDFFRSHGQTASALAASEAAYALNSKDRINKQRLGKDLTAMASGDCPVGVAVEQFDRALNLSIDYLQNRSGGYGLHDGSYFEADQRIGDFIAAHCTGTRKSATDESLESLRLKYRDYEIDRVQQWAAHPGRADLRADFASNALCSLIPHLNQCAISRKEFAGDLDEVVGNLWLGVYEKQTQHQWDYFPQYGELTMFINCIFRGYEGCHPYGFYNHGDSATSAPADIDLREYARSIAPLYQKLGSSNDPMISFWGKAGQVWSEAVGTGRSMDDLQEPFQMASKLAEETIQGSTDSDARDRMYVVWEMAIELFFRPDNHTIDDGSTASKQREKELYVMWDFRKGRHESPVAEENTKPAQTPWSRADRICDIHKTPGLEDIDALIHPLVRDGRVWAIGLGHDRERTFMQLFSLPLVEGPPHRLGKLDIEWSGETYVPPNCASNSGAALSDDCYYLTSRRIGILAFPLDGRAVSVINGKNGMPTEHVDSVASLDNHLYAGLGDGGYIIRYDPRNSRCDVLASSRRKDKQSPLDDDLVWEAPCMIADPSRHRVVLLAGGLGQGGIWQINSAGVLSQLYQTSQIAFGDWFSDLDGDHVIMATNSWILDMDLRTDQPTVLHKNPFVAIGPRITPVSSSITPNVTVFPPYLVQDGWLWCGFDFTRTDITTGKAQDLPDMTSSTGQTHVIPTEVLQSFDGGRHALMGDQQQLWQLTFDAGKTPATRP